MAQLPSDSATGGHPLAIGPSTNDTHCLGTDEHRGTNGGEHMLPCPMAALRDEDASNFFQNHAPVGTCLRPCWIRDWPSSVSDEQLPTLWAAAAPCGGLCCSLPGRPPPPNGTATDRQPQRLLAPAVCRFCPSAPVGDLVTTTERRRRRSGPRAARRRTHCAAKWIFGSRSFVTERQP